MQNNSEKKCKNNFKWLLTLPPCIPFVHNQVNGDKSRCEQGELPRRQRQSGHLVFSLDSKRIDSLNNRLVVISSNKPTPRSIHLAKDEGDNQNITVSFSVELGACKSQEIGIDLTYHVLLSHQIGNTVFLVALPDDQKAFWQGALAAAVSWVDRLETCHDETLGNLG